VNLEAQASRRTRLIEKIGRYVFGPDSATLKSLRDALENVRECIRNGVNDDGDPINGLRATVERAVRMTDADNWEVIKVPLKDGSETEARQFKPALEEEHLRAELTASSDANLQRLNIRSKIQSVLLDPGKSSPELLREALEWAKGQPAKVDPALAEDDDSDFDKESNRRAVVMTAAIVARDYEGADREDALAWARPILEKAPTQGDKEYLGNNQVIYNTTAIAALGLVSLYLKDEDAAMRNAALNLAGNDHPSVLEALGQSLLTLGNVDDRMPRSIVRITMVRAAYTRRADTVEQQREREKLHRATIEAAIAAEQRWLNGEGDEPSWPELPPWKSKPRRRLRLGDWVEEDDDDLEDETPSHFVDERTLGELVGYLVGFTVGELPAWVKDLATRLMEWTDEANGPHGENDHEREDLPFTWNIQFFDFVGVLCVALPHAEVLELFLNHVLKFKDEPFHDAMASFLRGYDRATLAMNTKDPEDPVEVRALLAGRIKQSWNYRRFAREKGLPAKPMPVMR
jgi:hypothetical protein